MMAAKSEWVNDTVINIVIIDTNYQLASQGVFVVTHVIELVYVDIDFQKLKPRQNIRL